MWQNGHMWMIRNVTVQSDELVSIADHKKLFLFGDESSRWTRRQYLNLDGC